MDAEKKCIRRKLTKRTNSRRRIVHAAGWAATLSMCLGERLRLPRQKTIWIVISRAISSMPNIILVLTDVWGWVIGSFGSQAIDPPNWIKWLVKA